MKKTFAALLMAMFATAAFAQQSATGLDQSQVSGPPAPNTPSPTGTTVADVSGPPILNANDTTDDVKMAGLGFGLVSLVGVGKLAKKRKAK
jgi:hypothetical protein